MDKKYSKGSVTVKEEAVAKKSPYTGTPVLV